MPPKGKAKAAPKAGRGRGGGGKGGGNAAAPDPAAGGPAAAGVNCRHLGRVMDALTEISGNTVLSDVKDKPPLPISNSKDSSTIAPFDRDQMKHALGSKGSYTCGGNLMWIDLLTSITPNVPVVEATVQKSMDKYFPSANINWEIGKVIIGLLPAQVESLANGAQPTSLRLISPEEYLHAFVLKVAQRVKDGAPMGELNQWSTLMLSLPMTFQVGASPEKLYFAGVTARENYGTGYDLLFRSAVQRIYELGVYRDSQPGKLTHKEIAARWKASVTFSTITDADETMQDWAGFVSTCISVYDRCLSNPTVSRLILDAEERWGKQTPWDSVGKLDTLCSKCTKSIGRSDPGSATDRMCWVIRAVHDFYDSEQIQKTQLSTRNFSGKGLYGHKGTCDILLYKYGLGIYIKDYLEGTIIDANQKAVIRSVFDDHESYRKAYGQHGHMEDYDVSWLGSLCQPARTACGLLKQLVYTVEEDARLKRMLHAGASCADWLDHDELSEKTGPLKSEMLALSSLERAVVEETPVVSTPQQKMQDSIVHTLKVSGSEESMESHVRSLPEADLARIMEAITYAKQHVRQFIKLFVDDEKEKLVLDALNESSLTRIAKSEFLLTCFDVKNSGEPVTCPHIRVAPLKNERLRRCIQRTCKFMSSPDGLPENMAFMVFDGGKFGNLAPIMSQFVDSKGTAMPKQTRTISICYEENSVIRRMERYRTMTSLQQLESCHLAA
ncbi:unnamed protein product [Symbiodinium sp. CCMP2592]|nr:unnamed protein product [Symbiodinium sp. CCMP2592]